MNFRTAKKEADEYEYNKADELEQENTLLKETIFQLKMELDRFRAPALMLAEFVEKREENAIIRVPNGNRFFVNISSSVKNLKGGDTVIVEQKNLTVVDRMNKEKKTDVEQFVILEKPTIKWKDIGGLDEQENEIKEVIELPLKKPELFKKIGIKPPKGILLHGPPGTGKTLLAKAVAESTNSTFIEIVGSELVQKFIGEGAKLVKDLFILAREKAPSIIFIDEIDAIASKRIDVGTSGEREVQRTFMQLLAEIDGFKPLDNVKLIGCTNRLDILDPAVTRPGRLDRLIEVPNPGKEGVKEIFKIHTKNMNLDKKIKKETIYKLLEGTSGAEIKATCMEAGYFAIRENRTTITQSDLEKGIKKVKKKEETEGKDYMHMYG
ncbi:AAA family ATPase [Candidatus Woesearchaeota archaeon]|nr:AAA family ATPase [Candidatus Woesearchaeota archaeon]MCF7900886.1 AAA family ATPase [Candidatus Woesearchaeota archaeon]MCF8013065.1 AAA family ATPase [Candidatus Woesearchaeota archaeon]